ncbi:MAG: BRCT domain-containing protein [Proteobacteria bacterium]|nr:BRCT domain-containing protein [Pseudomonadota bacterium]
MSTTPTTVIQKSLDHLNTKKATEHLLGICHGLTSDQHLNDQEIHFLSTWIKQNPAACTAWPGTTIARRVHEILADGIITEEERASLLVTLTQICSSDFENTGDTQATLNIPFDDDPHIIFPERAFCFTGVFYFGTRANCERATEKHRAMTKSNVSQSIDYLVIGSQINPDWAHTSFGRKIESAISYIEKGHGIAIISEQQWTEALSHLNK